MEIIKKIPVKRGKTENTQKLATRKAIKDAFEKGVEKEAQIIPAKRDLEAEDPNKKLRVCAYCRVSTGDDSQGTSYELQVQHYKQLSQTRSFGSLFFFKNP